MIWGAQQRTRVDLRSAKSRGDITRRIRTWMKEYPSLPWILGQWEESSWGGELPDRTWVDEVTAGKPLFLTRADMHSALVNSKALEIGGIGSDTPDPAGGKIVRDPRTGAPTGILLENAMDLVVAKIPPLAAAERVRALRHSFHLAHSFGVTAVHDILYQLNWEDLEIHRSALAKDRDGLRVFMRVPLECLDRLLAERKEISSRRFLLDGVKGFIDGALGSTTAWLEKPYAHDPSHSGITCVDNIPEFQESLKKAALANVSVSLHAIGDAAIGFAQEIYLDIIRRRLGEAPLRIEHFQHPGPKHLAAMGHPRMFASIQPAHLLDDAANAEERLGPERAALSYPLQSLLARGCPVVFGSDWDVADLNPLVGLQAAVTRVDKAKHFPGGWHPEQAIGLTEAIECYTWAGARATGRADRVGRLLPGMEADLAVLDRDLTSLPPEKITAARAILTVASGKIVYQNH
jgi:predicted amidohydrolase YtcJ